MLLSCQSHYTQCYPNPNPTPKKKYICKKKLGQGVASYYSNRLHGRKTASGERYNKNLLSAAHKTLPLGTMVRVTRMDNGKSVDVRINDRGPYCGGRIIDLSFLAAQKIGLTQLGVCKVHIDMLSK